ncbi:SapC family protein [Caulobacter sp. S45]|uniref:SapC family protein n=1 Tax=Caulobacter sp. S45 TaxID=1641861 RepID=UPI001C20AAEC|nr:SapC family protein [Caulobacter sp. S45]
MPNIVLLNGLEHSSLTVDARASAELGDDQRFVQVVAREFPLLSIQYPVLISKDSNTGKFFCGAMLGFDDRENLFLKDGGGHDGYRPLNLQRAPFYIAGAELAIDLDSPRVGGEEGRFLFDEQGRPSDFLKSVRGVFLELRPGLEMTQTFIATLVELKLVAPLEVDLAFDDGTERELQGLYTIDQNALHRLADETVVQLFRNGYMYLIHLMIMSVKQISNLAKRKNDRLLGFNSAGSPVSI